MELTNTSAPKTGTAQNNKTQTAARVNELLADVSGSLPIWIRAPKSGTEFYTGASRAKLYEWAGKALIRSVSIREPGRIKGTRLFHLPSILAFIEKCEAEATGMHGQPKEAHLEVPTA